MTKYAVQFDAHVENKCTHRGCCTLCPSLPSDIWRAHYESAHRVSSHLIEAIGVHRPLGCRLSIGGMRAERMRHDGVSRDQHGARDEKVHPG
jgi:hypothetical protein